MFLTPVQRKGLIDAASANAAAFLRGLELSGARPKELAEAVASDFDGERLKLSHRKGRLPRLRSRYVVLDVDGVAFFTSQAEGKSAKDRSIYRSRGQVPGVATCGRQRSGQQLPGFNRTAQGSTRVPTGASAYSFRHARISELLQVYGIDPLTVAAQTGTSLRMIERTYFKFIRSAMLEKLASLKTRPATQGIRPGNET